MTDNFDELPDILAVTEQTARRNSRVEVRDRPPTDEELARMWGDLKEQESDRLPFDCDICIDEDWRGWEPTFEFHASTFYVSKN